MNTPTQYPFLMSSPKRPRPDMQAVAQGDPQALALAVATLAAGLFRRANHSIRFPASAADVAQKIGPPAGLLAAAIDLRELLTHSPQGRQALSDLGFEPAHERLDT